MTSTSMLKVDCSATSDFGAFGGAIHTAFIAAGWTLAYSYSSNQASPGTSFSWSSINSVPSAAGTTYEVWAPGDLLQSLCPIYVRIDYWYSSGIYMQFTIGNSQASGVISGGLVGEGVRPEDAWVSQQHYMSDPGAGEQYVCLFSGSSSSFRMGLFLNAYSTDDAACYYAFERSRAVNGVETSSYMTFLAHSAAGKEQMSIGNRIRPTTSLSNWVIPFYTNNSAISVLGTVGLLPIFSFFDGIELPLQNTIVGRYQDIADGLTTVSLTSYGTTSTYMQIVNSTSSSGLGNMLNDGFFFSESGFCVLMLWS